MTNKTLKIILREILLAILLGSSIAIGWEIDDAVNQQQEGLVNILVILMVMVAPIVVYPARLLYLLIRWYLSTSKN